MDPLSITASTITLIQAAGAVSAKLYGFIKTFRNSDTRVSNLCSLLSRLSTFLEAVDQILEKCRGSLSLASIDEDLWYQSTLSLEDCKKTLDELSTFIDKISAVSKSSGFFRRAKVAVDLTMYAADISGFEGRIHKSNWALQTMLSAIQVSLSLRGNETQDKILYVLGELKYSIEQSIQATFLHMDGYSHHTLRDPSDARVAYNLQNLARVAQNFHYNASSTASTIHGASVASFWNFPSDATLSVRGGPGLTRSKKRQVDKYVKQQRRMTKKHTPLQRVLSSASVSVNLPSATSPAPAAAVAASILPEENNWSMSEAGDDNDEKDDETELELLLLSGLEEVAKDSMLNQDFAKAQSMLEEAIQRHTGSTSGDAAYKKPLIQLALCYLFQNKWRLAEPLIDRIAKSKTNFDLVVCNLLHALALANLSDNAFEKAIAFCKHALRGKSRLQRAFNIASEAEYYETLGLLATIYDAKGNSLNAEALRRMLPEGFSYSHPENEIEFIVKHTRMCEEVLGKKIVLNWKHSLSPAFVKGCGDLFELPGNATWPLMYEIMNDHPKIDEAARTAPLTPLSQYRRAKIDTEKHIILSPRSSVSDVRLSSRPRMPLKTSLMQGVSRFIGTVKGRCRSTTSRSGCGRLQTSDAENIYSPLRPNSSRGSWPISDSHKSELNFLNQKSQKRPNDETTRRFFSIFNRDFWARKSTNHFTDDLANTHITQELAGTEVSQWLSGTSTTPSINPVMRYFTISPYDQLVMNTPHSEVAELPAHYELSHPNDFQVIKTPDNGLPACTPTLQEYQGRSMTELPVHIDSAEVLSSSLTGTSLFFVPETPSNIEIISKTSTTDFRPNQGEDSVTNSSHAQRHLSAANLQGFADRSLEEQNIVAGSIRLGSIFNQPIEVHRKASWCGGYNESHVDTHDLGRPPSLFDPADPPTPPTLPNPSFPMLRFDPVLKDLVIVDSYDTLSSLAEPQILDHLLEELSKSVHKDTIEEDKPSLKVKERRKELLSVTKELEVSTPHVELEIIEERKLPPPINYPNISQQIEEVQGNSLASNVSPPHEIGRMFNRKHAQLSNNQINDTENIKLRPPNQSTLDPRSFVSWWSSSHKRMQADEFFEIANGRDRLQKIKKVESAR